MTTITIDRAVVEQALEALEQSETTVPYEGFGMARREAERKHQAAITALRAALAQQAEQQPMHPELRKMWEDHFDKCFRAIPVPEQAEPVEPVAWMVYTEGGTSAYVTDNPNDLVGAYRALPLYTAPPQRKPLTEEEIIDAVRDADLDWAKGWTLDEMQGNRFATLARAVERAHGIGEGA